MSLAGAGRTDSDDLKAGKRVPLRVPDSGSFKGSFKGSIRIL